MLICSGVKPQPVGDRGGVELQLGVRVHPAHGLLQPSSAGDVTQLRQLLEEEVAEQGAQGEQEHHHEAADDAGRRATAQPRAVSRRIAGSMAIAKSQDSMRMKKEVLRSP